MHTELIVVGAGPAGLAAAAAAADAGLDVLVVDERRGPGGRTSGPLGASAADPETGWLVPPLRPEGDARIERLHAAAGGAAFRFDAQVWGVFPGFTLAVAHGGRTQRVDADQVVLATGRHAVRSPFPGHHLPGVATPIGLHRALAEGSIADGQRVAILGDGPLADALADAIRTRSGAVVVRIADPSAAPREPGAPHPAPLRVTASGDRLRIASGNTPASVEEVDRLVVADTEGPAAELAALAGCEHRFAGYGWGFAPIADATGATTVPGVYLAGSVLGTRTDEATERSGTLAGLAAAERAGRNVAERLRALLAAPADRPTAGPELVPPSIRHLEHDHGAVACRCIGTTTGEVVRAIHAGARSVDDVKRHAKAGMGACQGRECHRAVVRLLDRIGDVDVGTLRPMRARPPVRPVTAGAMYAGEVES